MLKDDWLTYCSLMSATADQPFTNTTYYGLGLVEEVMEYVEDPSLEELGDVFWYFGGFAVGMGIHEFQEYKFEDACHINPTLFLKSAIKLAKQAIKRIRGKLVIDDFAVATHNFVQFLEAESISQGIVCDEQVKVVWQSNLRKVYDRKKLAVPVWARMEE